MTLWRKAALVIIALTGLASQSPAQDHPCLNRTVAVNVYTDEGRRVRGLGAQNFHGQWRSKPVEIVSANYDTAPRRIVILLDTSGSIIADRAMWESELLMANGLADASPPQHSLALLTFSNQVEDRVEFGQGREDVKDKLRELRARNWREIKGLRKTALLDAAVEGIALLAHPRCDDAIVLISDGGENASHEREGQVKRDFLESGVRLFTFLLLIAPANSGGTPEEVSGPSFFESLSEATGGQRLVFLPHEGLSARKFFPTKLKENDHETVRSLARSLAQEISDSYILQIKLPEPVDMAREWKLEVVDPASKKKPAWKVIYPRRLAPCK